MKKIYFGALSLLLIGSTIHPKRRRMKIKSEAFTYGSRIPKQYTCQGVDDSPPFTFSNIPKGTKSLALIFENRSPAEVRVTGAWVNWLVFNIPSTVTQLPADADIKSLGGIEGRNTWHELRYSGPCPVHKVGRYYFELYALDMMLDLDGNATKADMLKAAQGHVLKTARLVGIYKREK